MILYEFHTFFFNGKMNFSMEKIQFSIEKIFNFFKDFIQILSFREDLIGIIKPFMENLNNDNINDETVKVIGQMTTVRLLWRIFLHNLSFIFCSEWND